MVEEVVFCVFAGGVDGGAVAGAAPVVVGGDEGVGGKFLPGAKEEVGARDAFGVPALFAAAGVAGIEHVEAHDLVGVEMTHDVRAFDDALLPGLIVGDELGFVAGQREEVFCEGLAPDGGGAALGVAVFFPDEVRLAVFVACEAGVDGAVGLADEGAVVSPGTFRRGSSGYGDAERAATLAGDVPDAESASEFIVHQLGCPEGALCPGGLLGEDGAGVGPVGEVGGAEEGELGGPLAGGGGGPEGAADADDGGVGVVAGDDGVGQDPVGGLGAGEILIDFKLNLCRPHGGKMRGQEGAWGRR